VAVAPRAVTEAQRSLPSADALRVTMTAAVCQKLAAELLNALAESLPLAAPHPPEKASGP
jgi:hypothetical protein